MVWNRGRSDERSTMQKRTVAAGAAAALAIAGGGAALAATKLTSPKEENQAIVADAAKQLGVEPQALTDALVKAIEKRIDAAVADGRLTQAQANELEQRLQSGGVPLLPGRPFHEFGHGGSAHFGGPTAAATYLGLSVDELRTQLQSGKTLADVANAHGKSVSGLVDSLVADAKTHLDQAVASGRLTQAQEDEILGDLRG